MSPITSNKQGGVGKPMPSNSQRSDGGQNVNSGSESRSPEELRKAYEEIRSRYEHERSKWEMDMNRMKSSLQSNAAREKNELAREVQELRQRLDEATLTGMTDEQRKEFELKRVRERYEELERQYQQTSAQLEDQRRAQEIREAFLAKYGKHGLSKDDIDVSTSDNAVASAWTKIGELFERGASGESRTSQSGEATRQVVEKETETRVVGSGGVVPSTESDPMLLLRKTVAARTGQNLEDVSPEHVTELMFQGQIDVNEVLSQEYSDD
jgi:CRISPR/Cas system CSM-associated protein Csm2 small subunit